MRYVGSLIFASFFLLGGCASYSCQIKKVIENTGCHATFDCQDNAYGENYPACSQMTCIYILEDGTYYSASANKTEVEVCRSNE